MPTIVNIPVINLTLANGTQLPLRHFTSKNGNSCFAALAVKADGERYFSKYGVRVKLSVFGGTMPKAGETITILDTKFKLEADVNQRKQAQVRTKGSVVVPGAGKKQFQLLITDLGDGEANLSAKIVGVSEGGGRKGHGVEEL